MFIGFVFGHTFGKYGKRPISEEEIATKGIIKQTNMTNNVDSGNKRFVKVNNNNNNNNKKKKNKRGANNMQYELKGVNNTG